MDRPNAEASGEPAPEKDSPAGTGNKRLRIVTRCSTVDEFFATFGAFADESSLFIVTNKPRALGLVQPFVIQLKDGTTIMRGEVEVILSTTDGRGPEGRNGMRLKFLQADEGTREVLRRLLEHSKAKRSMAPPPGDLPAPAASEIRPAPARDTETTQISGAPQPEPGTKQEAPAFGGPSSTTQLSPPGDASSPAARGAPVTIARPTPDVPARAGSDPAAGERAPGAAFQLPANPFESITAEALESFVECTLYEERVPRVDEPVETSVIFALPNSPSSVYPPPAGAPVPGARIPAELPAGIPPPPPVGVPAAGPPTFSPAGAPTFGPAPAAGPPGPPPPAVVRDAVLLAAAIQAASVPATKPARRTWIVAVTAVVSSVATLVAAYMLWGRSPDPAPDPAPTQSVSSSLATAVPPATSSPAPSAAPTASAASTSTLPRECRAHVRSYPLGASVSWNGEPIGPTPLSDAPVPCGPARVTFELTGYETGERSAVALAGKPAGAFLRLTPVRIPLDVTSTPPGAYISLEGRSMGRTPATLTLMGPRESTLVLRLTGYQTWTHKITPEPPRVTVHADLQKK